MARVYNTRTLLDAGSLQNMSNIAQLRANYNAQQNALMGSGMKNFANTAGKAVDDYIQQKIRENEVNDSYADSRFENDPVYNAAKEEYIRTGSSGPMSNYLMQIRAEEARKQEAAQRAQDAARDKAWHDAVRLSQARPQYIDIQNKMLAAADSGDYDTANMYKAQLDALETEYGKVFGQDANTVLEARKKTAEAKAEKERQEAEAEAEKARQEAEAKALQDKEEAERQYKVAIFKSTLPTTFKNEAAKQAVYKQIQDNEDMTVEEKTKLINEIRSIESGATANKKAAQGAVASKVGEQTGKEIDEKNKQKELAYKAKEKLSKNYKLTKEEKEAYDKEYGGK